MTHSHCRVAMTGVGEKKKKKENEHKEKQKRRRPECSIEVDSFTKTPPVRAASNYSLFHVSLLDSDFPCLRHVSWYASCLYYCFRCTAHHSRPCERET
uniref:Uncharacterized protein n=1 Tax=Trichogramma kaykai TaxID=54128 RepID=A0ABD2W2Q8_9HYME